MSGRHHAYISLLKIRINKHTIICVGLRIDFYNTSKPSIQDLWSIIFITLTMGLLATATIFTALFSSFQTTTFMCSFAIKLVTFTSLITYLFLICPFLCIQIIRTNWGLKITCLSPIFLYYS